VGDDRARLYHHEYPLENHCCYVDGDDLVWQHG
jgi:hypothetical protein